MTAPSCIIIRRPVVWLGAPNAKSGCRHKSETQYFQWSISFMFIVFVKVRISKGQKLIWSFIHAPIHKSLRWVQTFFSYSISQDLSLRGENNSQLQWETQEMRLVRKFFQSLHVKLNAAVCLRGPRTQQNRNCLLIHFPQKGSQECPYFWFQMQIHLINV